jgi:AcrR family transcriptional regulator
MDDPASRRGRPRNAESAREAILDAAEQVFAEHGFDGARIDAIAAASGYNKSLMFQYFHDKLGLYAEVIRRADDQTREMQNEALRGLNEGPQSADQLRALLGNFIGWYFDYLVAHPQVLRIFIWEMAEGWQTFTKIVSQRDFDDVDQFAPALQKIQQAGLLRSDLDPFLQLLSAIFTCHSYLAILPLFKTMVPGLDHSSPEALARARTYIVDFVIRGLLTDPSEVKP